MKKYFEQASSSSYLWKKSPINFIISFFFIIAGILVILFSSEKSAYFISPLLVLVGFLYLHDLLRQKAILVTDEGELFIPGVRPLEVVCWRPDMNSIVMIARQGTPRRFWLRTEKKNISRVTFMPNAQDPEQKSTQDLIEWFNVADLRRVVCIEFVKPISTEKVEKAYNSLNFSKNKTKIDGLKKIYVSVINPQEVISFFSK